MISSSTKSSRRNFTEKDLSHFNSSRNLLDAEQRKHISAASKAGRSWRRRSGTKIPVMQILCWKTSVRFNSNRDSAFPPVCLHQYLHLESLNTSAKMATANVTNVHMAKATINALKRNKHGLKRQPDEFCVFRTCRVEESRSSISLTVSGMSSPSLITPTTQWPVSSCGQPPRPMGK